MSLHKLTAGDGYTYLTRQVAAHDATQRGYASLGDYYEQKGESPGEWLGRGLSSLPGFSATEAVSEAQMRALFGEGRHPDADKIEARLRADGMTDIQILAATRLGQPFPVYASANEFRRRTGEAFSAYNADLGLPRDRSVPAEDRARIRTAIAEEMFGEEYGRPPADERERAGWMARISRQATTAVAGWDMTFSPVKSVSALWAIAPRPVAEQIEAAHRAAVLDAVAWLEDHATYTRTGAGGVAQVEVTGLLAAAFTHRDSRAGDPDLHTHVAISNKVCARHDGRWRALDGRPLHQMTVAASERYNTRLEAELTARLGVAFAERGQVPGKRPVRELVGISFDLLAAWSRRRQAIEVRRGELAADFQRRHGRPPNVVEALDLAQQATLETRQGKHEPRSLAEQRTAWAEQAEQVLGGRAAVARMLAAVLAPRAAGPVTRVSRRWVRRAAAAAVTTVARDRATWQETHVRAEAERLARSAGIARDRLDAAVDAIVAAALSPRHCIPLQAVEPVTEPAALQRSDGASVYTVAGSARYTSTAILDAERALVAAAGRRDGRRAEIAFAQAAATELAASKLVLNPSQTQLVNQMTSSGARLQLGLAPAGTGKTTAMRALSRAWALSGGRVLGLAPSAVAAKVLGAEIGVHTDTLAKLQHALASHARAGTPVPDWVAAIGPDTLVVVDEAGMAATTDLAAVAEYVIARGGSLRLIGDDQQLAAIGAGGVLRDIADVHGALTLTQVVRFADPAEGAASLALRAGDPTAIAYYTDNHRVHVGDLATAVEQAYTAWTGDLAAGRDAVMLAPTLELVAELNARARADRLARAGTTGTGPQVAVADGGQVSAGDVIITRDNDRRLRLSSNDWVKNGDRWTVTAVADDGGLHARQLGTGLRVHLPAGYTGEHVTLGYATTVHTAQGVTADVSHVIAAGTEIRQLLYVALTRGRDANHLYLTTAGDGDPHTVITRDALLPPTAVDILTRILGRDGAAVSATGHARDLADPAARLREAADRYAHALTAAAEHRLGPHAMADLDAHAAAALPCLNEAGAWPTLRAHLALHALAGADPAAVLHDAIGTRELDTAVDAAAVLDWRLDPTRTRTGAHPVLPWLPGIPPVLAADPTWGPYLHARADLLTALAGDVAAAAAAWTPATAPAWAAALLERDPALTTDLAVWRAATGVGVDDPRPAGPNQPAAARSRHQRRLSARATAVLGAPDGHTARWQVLAETIDPRILSDPTWPALAARLNAASRAGVDITALATAVAAHHRLSDEQPAAALWWRLARHLPPALTTPATHTPPTALRPDWTPALTDLFGPTTAERIQADPAWPALVAAVTTATARGWQAGEVLVTATELLLAGQDEQDPLREDELAGALTWRIGLLTDHGNAPAPDLTPLPHGAPPDPAEEPPHPDDIPPPDLHAAAAVPAAGTRTAAAGRLVAPPQGRHRHIDTPATVRGRPDPAGPADGPGTPPVAPIASGTSAAADMPPPAPPTAPASTAPGGGQVPARRVRELNALAQEFFTARYTAPGGWARGYLLERLGLDPDEAGAATDLERRFTPGYAPQGWTSLVSYLNARGATDAEIVAAGLGTPSSRGGIIDRFRDRLILPIGDTDGIAGFVARRNPAHDGDPAGERHGPKYLNTSNTPAYTKGALLYGVAETSDLRAAGASPVLVEGPLDAIAVTLAGRGRHVGLAPLGTALTDTQADQLQPYLTGEGAGVVVGTDPDPAGRVAAVRAYWLLAARGANPGLLHLPDGLDPAAAHAVDPDLLRDRLDRPVSLAAALVDDAIAAWTSRLDTVEGRIGAMRDALAIIGALRPGEATPLATRLIADLDLLPDTVVSELAEAAHAWDRDPHGQAHQHLRRTPAATRTVQAPPAAPQPLAPHERWKPLADSIDPRLTTDPAWPALAATIHRAHNAWVDVDRAVPALTAARHLDEHHPARDLRFRLIRAHPQQAAADRAPTRTRDGDRPTRRPAPAPPPPRPALRPAPRR